jgi:hypothetical protein
MFLEVSYGETNCSSLPWDRFKREDLVNMKIGSKFVTNVCMNFQCMRNSQPQGRLYQECTSYSVKYSCISSVIHASSHFVRNLHIWYTTVLTAIQNTLNSKIPYMYNKPTNAHYFESLLVYSLFHHSYMFQCQCVTFSKLCYVAC